MFINTRAIMVDKNVIIPDNSKIASTAVVKGNVTLGEYVGVWYGAVIRCEEGSITIGNRSNIQDGAIIHLDPGGEVVVGDDVTIGHRAIVHGCKVGNNTVIGMGSIILNGASIGNNCIIGAGAVVTGGVTIPDGSMVVGVPGKILRSLSPAEIQHNKTNAMHYVDYISLIE